MSSMAEPDWDDKLVRFEEEVHRRQVVSDSLAATPQEPAVSVAEPRPQSSQRVSARDCSRRQTLQRLLELEHVLDLLGGAEGTERVRRDIAQMRERLRHSTSF
jgi:hypothetical protein